MEAAVTFSQHPFRFIESLDAAQAETVVQFCRVRREIEWREKMAVARSGGMRA